MTRLPLSLSVMPQPDTDFTRGMARRFVGYCVRVGAALIAAHTYAQAQGTPRRLNVETLSPEAAGAYRVWQRYLASKNGEWSANAASPSVDWLQSEQ